MRQKPNKIESFLRLRKGASTLEYIIIIAAAVILGLILYNFISGGGITDKVNGKIQSALEGKVDSTQGNGSPSPETPPPPPKPKPTPPPKKEEKKGFFEKIVDNPIVQETTNFVLDSVPVVSNIKSGYEAISGKDIFGNELSTADRIAAGAGVFIPGAKHGKRLLNGVEKVADATGVLKPGCAAKKKKGDGDGNSECKTKNSNTPNITKQEVDFFTESGKRGYVNKRTGKKVLEGQPLPDDEIIVIAGKGRQLKIRDKDNLPLGDITTPGKSGSIGTTFDVDNEYTKMFRSRKWETQPGTKILSQATVKELREAGYDVLYAPTDNKHHIRIIPSSKQFDDEGREILDKVFKEVGRRKIK